MPPTSRKEIQNQGIRDQQLDPDLYYPEGYKPELLKEWPVDGDLLVPLDQMPPDLKHSMGDRWRQKVESNKILDEQAGNDQ